MKRKSASIALLFCLLAPVASTFIYLQLQKKEIKGQVKEKILAGIDKQELHLLKFTQSQIKEELRWEHSREFEYRGEMYDVVEKKVLGDTTYFWCWWDYEETTLNKNLRHMLAKVLGRNPNRKEKKEQLQDFFKKLFYAPQIESLSNQKAPETKLRALDHQSSPFWHRTPPVPPPRVSACPPKLGLLCCWSQKYACA